MTGIRPATPDKHIAVIGSGVAGLACAHLLDGLHRVTLFEADDRPGGHANTVTVDDPDAGPLGVDTGFIVHNDRNYPNLVRLFDQLGVATRPSEMSFGVADGSSDFAYRATNLATLLARPANAVDPRLWRMLVDIIRFFRHARRFLADPDPNLTIGAFLERGRYSDAFLRLHLLPMGAAVWSTGPTDFTRFPAASLLAFLDNHGLLGVGDRPQWRTVVGGSTTYVQAILDRFGGEVRLGCPVAEVSRTGRASRPVVTVASPGRREEFDAVILACHSDQARKLLVDRTVLEDDVLGGVAYLDNEAVLHTDISGTTSPDPTSTALPSPTTSPRCKACRAATGTSSPSTPTANRRASWPDSSMPTPSSIWPPSRRRAASTRSTGRAGSTSAGRGGATASTRTGWSRPSGCPGSWALPGELGIDDSAGAGHRGRGAGLR